MKGGTIAIAGKGGVGKTCLSALLVRKLTQFGSVLAVDGDPDSNLPLALGVEVKKTLGDARESIANAPRHIRGMMTKEEYAKASLQESIEEFDKFDLVVMGRPEESGCYCFVNKLVRQLIDFRIGSYDFTVIDCHAGLEHLSRRTTKGVDFMIAVTEPTKNGILTAKRVVDLARDIAIDVGSIMVVANKVSSDIKPVVDKIAKENSLKIDAYIPFDDEMLHLQSLGRPVVDLSLDSPVSIAIDRLYEKIFESNSSGG